jgi:hypothetical protein
LHYEETTAASQGVSAVDRNRFEVLALDTVRKHSRRRWLGAGSVGDVATMGEEGLKGPGDMIAVVLLVALVLLAPVLYDVAAALGA